MPSSAAADAAAQASCALHESPRQVAQRRQIQRIFGASGGVPVMQRAQTVHVYVGTKLVELSTEREDQAMAIIKQFSEARNLDGLRDIVAGFRNFAAADGTVARRISDAAMDLFDYVEYSVRDERMAIQRDIAQVRQGLQAALDKLRNQRGAASASMQSEIDEAIALASGWVPASAAIAGYVAGAGRNIAQLSGSGSKLAASREYIIHARDYLELQEVYALVRSFVGDFSSRIWSRIADRVVRLGQVATAQIVEGYQNATEAKLLLYDGLLGAQLPAQYTPQVLMDLVFRYGATQAHMDLVPQVQNIPAASVLAFLQANPGVFVADIARWDQAAQLINHGATFASLFTSAFYIQRCAGVLAILQAGVRTTARRLAAALGRDQANYARIDGHVNDLEDIAARLNAGSIDTLCSEDFYLTNLAQVHGLFQATPHIDGNVLLTVCRNRLVLLRAHEADIDRALNGVGGLTVARLNNVLDHLDANNALPALQADLDTDIQNAQSLGAELRNVMASPLGQPANAAYVANLAWSVDNLGIVTWGNRGGVFSNGQANLNFGGQIRVPDSVSGFRLSNHVIAHLINPRDNNHMIRVSDIRAMGQSYAGLEIDNLNGGMRHAYQANGMRMFAPQADDHFIITIYFG
jgi:hypothetical protein